MSPHTNAIVCDEHMVTTKECLIQGRPEDSVIQEVNMVFIQDVITVKITMEDRYLHKACSYNYLTTRVYTMKK